MTRRLGNIGTLVVSGDAARDFIINVLLMRVKWCVRSLRAYVSGARGGVLFGCGLVGLPSKGPSCRAVMASNFTVWRTVSSYARRLPP